MANSPNAKTVSAFLSNLPGNFQQQDDPVSARLLPEYGAVFIARNGVTPPDRVIFRDENQVKRFQDSVEIGRVNFGEITIGLQKKAAEDLKQAVEAAKAGGFSITPRAADSGRRSYADTVELWHSRVEPALVHWTKRGDLESREAERIRSLSPFEQVPVVFELESRGLFFAKDLSKSIIYSVAPPGASQHLSMLAFDVSEFGDPTVREILASHNWYQTVVSDLPHFTYLGVSESELGDFGLRQVENAERKFWVPDM